MMRIIHTPATLLIIDYCRRIIKITRITNIIVPPAAVASKYALRVTLYATILLLSLSGVSAQTIKGHIEDVQGARIPFATLYVKELKQGVTSNADGAFELSAPVGTYTCLFRCLGYEMITDTVVLTAHSAPLRVVLPETVYELPSVRISATGEDPAYAIMRRAISRAPYFRQAVTEFLADVYIKGSLRVGAIKGLAGLALDKKTKRALSNSSGVFESVNEVRFTAPDRYDHRTKSVQQAVSFDMDDFKMPDLKVGMMLVDIYDPGMNILSTRAFSNYTFRYEGDFLEGALRINKIKVTSRYKRKDLYSGYLYIVEDLWNVYSFDLSMDYMGMDFRLEQHYGETADGIYLPVSSKAGLTGKIMGIELSGHYNASIKYSLITPNDRLSPLSSGRTPPPDAVNPKKARIEEQLTAIVSKDQLTTRDMRRVARMQQELAEMADDARRAERGEEKTLEVKNNYSFSEDSVARRRDTSYWNTVRPIPLVRDEVTTFRKNDSLRLIASGRDTSSAARSSRWKSGLFKLIGGDTFRIDSTLFVSYGGLMNINGFDFNTVDGFVYGQSASIVKRFSRDRHLTFRASAAWAFSRHTVLWDAVLWYRYLPRQRGVWSIEAGHHTEDYAGNRGIGMVNIPASLLFRVNYPVFYDKRYLRIHHTIDLANGLQLATTAAYEINRQETNHCDYSFFFSDSREYRPNIPRHAGVAANPGWLHDRTDFLTDIKLTYTPQYYYRMRGERKQMLYSHYPTFTARWQRAWDKVADSRSQFDFFSLDIRQHIRLHAEASVDYQAEAGFFANTRNMGFHSFRHFYSNDASILLNGSINRPFHLLPAYTYSTGEWFVVANVEYRSFFMALKRLPFLSSSLMSERLSVSYLQTPHMRHYTEWGYGLTELYLIGQIGVFVGFEGLKFYGWGVRAAITLDASL
ncbi:MAG: DUF5686 and carboxypeptidase regulatory-like domain-containing protein [Prevotellaceae bacterium]|nr:DUF5686 and carboxypeptidase regulatory-like domain-containing protein [Prevotellaceae bacterium]